MNDPVLLITGGSSGLGAATAAAAARAGYRLVLTARGVDRLAAFAAGLGGPERVLTLPCDVGDWSQISGVVAKTEETFGRLDAVFANAGSSVGTSFLGRSGEDPELWREMVVTNVCGPAYTARAALPALMRSRGHLVLTGSASGRGVRPGSLYSATKWAVTGLAQAIRAECVGTGVRVTIVQPGLVDTEAIPADRKDDPKLDPADVARAVLYALEQPSTVDVNEIVIRPVGQDAYK
ncbi:SDR family oxidoreductase [Kutzneria kofuensis]|uniref:NADP-dependent 3-hydroxy acid dehydrogenase YdfG n=1 Tax=Kutzneria kofuensis TaxID=103725 RepID=A0A7W9KMK7_9PSEU|nr:SDR family oxidoreductase [Kutzneria kofuensis]MBB5895255.1 NADP-dependent 3-hydroxy acid dehydrogenase YdfG [Kutzneria kofuensis]